MRLGFIGTGTITEAIVTGLCREPGPLTEIWVSPRSPEKARQLARAHTIVQTAASNQDTADHSDILFLAFLPGMEQDILGQLVFREDQTVVTLLAGIVLERITPLVAPAQTIVRAVPLPCTALCTGPVVMYPDDPGVKEIFSKVGSVIIPEKEAQLETFALITALMAPFYALTDTVAGWGASNGLDSAQSAAYTGAMFKALSLIAETEPKGNIGRLVSESMTPGGFNETAMAHISEHGGFSSVAAALDAVAKKFSRI